MGQSENCGAACSDFDFEYEFVYDCAAADESAGEWVWWDGVPAAVADAAAAGDGAEEWVG